jgi:hypothetical protein
LTDYNEKPGAIIARLATVEARIGNVEQGLADQDHRFDRWEGVFEEVRRNTNGRVRDLERQVAIAEDRAQQGARQQDRRVTLHGAGLGAGATILIGALSFLAAHL